METTQRRLVVVGVDGAENSVELVRYALEEGLRRKAGVEVVTAWTWEAAAGGMSGPHGFDETRGAVQEMQDRVVASALEGMAETPSVSQTLVQGNAAEALLEAARRAAVLVVGHRRHRFLARAVLGSVAERCVRHAGLPVVVVPAVRGPDDESEEAVALRDTDGAGAGPG